MNEKINFSGGEPTINFDDLNRNNIANRAALFAVMKAFNIGTNENFIISGCVTTLDTGVDVDVTAGYVFLNEEILQVEAQTVVNGGTLDLYKYVKSTTFDSGGNKTFNDSTARQTWAKNRGIVTAATAPILTTELDVISGDRLEEKVIGILRNTSTSDATEALKGIAEIATTAEAQALTDDTTIITPAKLADVNAGYLTKEINIGDWDMNTTAVLAVAHGLTAGQSKTIMIIGSRIRDDADAVISNLLLTVSITSAGARAASVGTITATDINLAVTTGSLYQTSADYNGTGFSRGDLLIAYIP